MKRTVARWASSKPPTASTSAKPSVQHATLTSARRRNYDLAILGGGLFLFVGAVLWEVKRRQKLAEATHAKLNVSSQSTSFTVKDGKSSSKTLDMLSSEQVNERLIRSAGSMTLARPGNPVQRVDSSSLPSNEPCEDDAVFTLLERDHSPEDTAKDLVFFGVFDGHSGWHTSRTLREKLISYVARELHAVYTGASMYQQLRLQNLAQTSPDSNQTPAKPAESFFRRLLSSGWLTKSASGDYILKDLDADDSILAAAIRNAFKSLDSDIVLSPIRLLERQGLFLSSTASSHTKGNVSEAQANAVQTLLPAMSGSCALLAFIDAARQKLHVASTGDSRAVMGTWDETAGKWRVDILTEDQTAKNSKEADRVRSEHPESEKDTVIARGRILGGLEPSRAFGYAECVLLEGPD